MPQVLPIESAALPTAPASPNPKLNLMLGAVLGLGLALGYAMLRHTVDRKLRTKEDIESKFDVSVVGGVPVARVLAAGRHAGGPTSPSTTRRSRPRTVRPRRRSASCAPT